MVYINYTFSQNVLLSFQLYAEDWFGLRTLFERGDVVLSAIPGVKHTEWHGNKTVFKDFIEPFLV